MAQDARKRGRPTEVDAAKVAHKALGMFERRGLERVTMDEIAERCGVSRRTLFRWFPSKADLVWFGLDAALAGGRARIAALGPGRVSLAELVEVLFVPDLLALDGAAPDPSTAPNAFASTARRRLLLVARSPELLSHPALTAMQSELSAVIADRVESAAPPSLVANSLVAVAVSAVLWWAHHGQDRSAAAVLRDALASVASAAPSAAKAQ